VGEQFRSDQPTMYSTRGLLLLALASVASLQSIQAFVTPAAPALRDGAVRRASCRGGVQALRAEREDGATEAQVTEAYKTYNMLMKNNNFGKGYWLDDKPFFSNIVEAFERNFGKAKSVSLADLEDADAPAGSVNLKKSIFKPLVPVGDTDVEDEKPKAPEPVTVAEPIKAKVDDDEDADFKELQEKMAAAKKKKSD